MKLITIGFIILVINLSILEDQNQQNIKSDGVLNEILEKAENLSQTVPEAIQKENTTNLELLNISTFKINESKPEIEDAKILSFSEWKGINPNACDDDDNETTEIINEKIVSNIQSVNTTTQSPSYQNYASKDCGARIIASNPESEHVNDALSYDLDAYALNPCYSLDDKGKKIPTSIFFVIQLCEKISISSFAISNGEIYSSNPKNIKLSYAISHDSHEENEWHEVGTFLANDSKNLQTFKLHSLTRFTKVVKLEVLDHYENDPYCPITTIQFFGISIIDKLTFSPKSKSKTINKPENSQNSIQINLEKPKGLFSTLINNFVTSYLKFSIPGNNINNPAKNRKSSVVPNFNEDISEKDKPKTNSDYSLFNSKEDINMVCSIQHHDILRRICMNLTKMCPNYDIGIPLELQIKICSHVIPDSNSIAYNLIQETRDSKNTKDHHVSDFTFEFDPSIPNSIHILKIKIRDLRKNLSLTTKYLEDVSVKFRQAIEDLKRETNDRISELERKNKFIYDSLESLVEVITEQNRKIQLIIEHLYLVHEKNLSIQEFNSNITWFLYFNAFITQLYFLYLLLNKLAIILKRLENRFVKWFRSPKNSPKISTNNSHSVCENPKISLTSRIF